MGYYRTQMERKGNKAKIIVISDPATIHDLNEWKEELDTPDLAGISLDENINEAV